MEIKSAHNDDQGSDGMFNDSRDENLRDAYGLLTPYDLGTLLGLDERTLAVWRVQKRGPDYVKLGRSIFYRRQDVLTWINMQVTQTDRTG